jgi:hypothetical protein
MEHADDLAQPVEQSGRAGVSTATDALLTSDTDIGDIRVSEG